MIAIVHNNPKLLAEVQGDVIDCMIQNILTFGRRSRWLKLLMAFTKLGDVPFKKNQNIVMIMLLEHQEKVLDLTADYRPSEANPNVACINSSDSRMGKTHIDLMRDADHIKYPYFSLLEYHVCSIQILAQCAAGKHRVNKDNVVRLVPLEKCIDKILRLDILEDGTRADDLDMDTLSHVKQCWLELLVEVFFRSDDAAVMYQVDQIIEPSLICSDAARRHVRDHKNTSNALQSVARMHQQESFPSR